MKGIFDTSVNMILNLAFS